MVQLLPSSQRCHPRTSTDPHHRHVPPDIEHHRVPAPDISFTRPESAFLIEEITRAGVASVTQFSMRSTCRGPDLNRRVYALRR